MKLVLNIPPSQFPLYKLVPYDELLEQFYEHGFVVIDLGLSEETILEIRRFTSNSVDGGHSGSRATDGWKSNAAVRYLATNAIVLKTVEKLFGRQPIPFQTLNFKVGTEQPAHSDMTHFNSLPQYYMCGAWVALEDVGSDNGPLVYYDGSHRLPYLNLDMLGLRPVDVSDTVGFAKLRLEYEQKISELLPSIVDSKCELHIHKGQCMIWAANLIHGGGKVLDKRLTRYSQVTHYYFERCLYYTPWFSSSGSIHYRKIEQIK